MKKSDCRDAYKCENTTGECMDCIRHPECIADDLYFPKEGWDIYGKKAKAKEQKV